MSNANFVDIKSEKDFLDIVQQNQNTFVDFYAPWCGPCRMVLPTIEEISKEVNDVKFVKVNVDDLPEIAAQFGVSGIPRFIFMKSGEPVDDLIGARPKEQILHFINKNK